MATNHLSEKEIVEKIRKGEINYFESIVKQYSSKIQHYILKRLNNQMDADDLTQNAFLKLYQAITDYKFNEKMPVAPYLFQIAANELKMHYRSMKRTVSLEEIPEIEGKSEEIDFSKEDITTALGFLTQNEKQALLMIGDGYKYDEVAVKFKVSINTVKTWIRRGREKMRNKNRDK